MSDQAHHAEESFAPSEESSMADYLDEGASRARALKNRGPLRFDSEGRLDPEIVEAYERIGFYVFENAIDEAELTELQADLEDLLERAPAGEGPRGRCGSSLPGRTSFGFAVGSRVPPLQ